MSAPCPSCGLRSCNHIDCYLDSPEDNSDTGITLTEFEHRYADLIADDRARLFGERSELLPENRFKWVA